MTTFRQALYTLLANDTALKALATGGVHDAASLDRAELRLSDLTGATPVIRPGVFVRWVSETPIVSDMAQLTSVFFDVYLYDDPQATSGYETIRQMRRRVYALLHLKTVSFDNPAADWLYQMRWTGDVLDQIDDGLGGALMERASYQGYLLRG